MTIEKNKLFKIALAFSFIFTITGALLKILHWENATFFLIIGILSTLIYISIGIYEVTNSDKVRNSEKIFWTIGFVFLSSITALFYLLIGRKNIV